MTEVNLNNLNLTALKAHASEIGIRDAYKYNFREELIERIKEGVKFNDYNKYELMEMARNEGIRVNDTMKKEQMIRKLENPTYDDYNKETLREIGKQQGLNIAPSKKRPSIFKSLKNPRIQDYSLASHKDLVKKNNIILGKNETKTDVFKKLENAGKVKPLDVKDSINIDVKFLTKEKIRKPQKRIKKTPFKAYEALQKFLKRYPNRLKNATMSGSKKLEKELQTKIKNRNLELEKLFKANETASAFNKFTNMYTITGLDMIDKKKFDCYKCFDGYSADWFFNNAEDNIIRVLRQNKPTKVKLVFHCKMEREMDGQLQIKEFGFSSAHELNLYGTDEKELFDKMIDKIIYEMDKVERAEGTGWNLHSITDLQLHTVEWVPQNGGSYFELDQYLKSKGAIINMKNKDNQCFKWCILRALNLFKNNNERINEN